MTTPHPTDDDLRVLAALVMLEPGGRASPSNVARQLRTSLADVLGRCETLAQAGLMTKTMGPGRRWVATTEGRKRGRGFAVA